MVSRMTRHLDLRRSNADFSFLILGRHTSELPVDVNSHGKATTHQSGFVNTALPARDPGSIPRSHWARSPQRMGSGVIRSG